MDVFLQRLAALALLTVLLACSTLPQPQRAAGVSLPFRLDVSVPGAVPTKSSVSGAEGIHGLQLICFDENGLYAGLGSASYVPASGEDTAGSLVGSVPGHTACIHFIANAGLVPSADWKSMPESELIGNLCADVSSTHIVYWGCHREEHPENLALWLDATPRNTILLLRDRAKITVEAPDPAWNHSSDPSVTENIVSLRFAVCNGRSEGKIAPFDKSTLSFAYDAPLTLPSGHLRYTADASHLVPCTDAQFLFEDENSLENSVKVILETTYLRGTAGNMSPVVKYHQALLMDSDYALYPVRRNHQYNIIVGNLPSSLAYDSFEEARQGSPSNNQVVLVKEIIPQVSSEGCSLTILDGTTHIIQKERSGGPLSAAIAFSFLKNGMPDPLTDISDFTAEWLSNKYVSEPGAALTLTEIAGRPGYFHLHVPLYQPITDDLKEGKILLRNARYGLSRFVNIYSITAFDFKASLAKPSGPEEPFVLGFTIPAHFPSSLFPFKVRILTESLTPTPAQNAQKALGIEVRDTGPKYGVPWDFCYTYEVFEAGAYSVSFAALDPSVTTPVLILDAEYFGTLDAAGERILDYVRIH